MSVMRAAECDFISQLEPKKTVHEGMRSCGRSWKSGKALSRSGKKWLSVQTDLNPYVKSSDTLSPGGIPVPVRAPDGTRNLMRYSCF